MAGVVSAVTLTVGAGTLVSFKIVCVTKNDLESVAPLVEAASKIDSGIDEKEGLVDLLFDFIGQCEKTARLNDGGGLACQLRRWHPKYRGRHSLETAAAITTSCGTAKLKLPPTRAEQLSTRDLVN